MLKAYKYRIYPTSPQKEQMEQHFGCCRLIWNLALSAKTQAYDSNKIRLSRIDLQKQLVELKTEYKWLYDINSQSLQSVLFNLEKTYIGFYTGGGFPKFKNKSSRQSFSCPQRVKLNENLIQIPKIGWVSIVVSRKFSGAIKTVTVSKETTGKYYVSILVDNGKSLPIKPRIASETTVGIDLGLTNFAIMSDGVKIDSPKYYKQSLARLKCLSRRVSRKKKGSNRRRKAIMRLTLQHEKVANQRKDFLHKLSSAITKQYDTVCVEDLATKNMIQNRKLSQSIGDVGWGEFLRQLSYKSGWCGKNYFKVPRFFASSKTCSHCGAINETLTLADRGWCCVNCSTVHDRDINAAKNIKQYFLINSGKGIPGESVELLPIGRAKKRKIKKDIPNP